MFNLIIGVIAIALVVALAAATLYYGGDAFTGSTAQARAATLSNQGQQIAAGAVLYESDNGSAISALTDLTSNNYLQTVPDGIPGDGGSDDGSGVWQLTDADSTDSVVENDIAFVILGQNDAAVCGEANEAATGTNAVPADDFGVSDWTSVNSGDPIVDQTFGCFQDDTATTPVGGITAGDYVFFYKY